MNLGLLIGRFPPGALGGAEHQAECWATRLADRHRVTVVTRRETPGPLSRERRDGFEVVRLPVSRVPVWRALHDARSIERVVRSIEPRPDLLLCFQTFVSGFAGVRIQRHTGIPAVVWIRGEAEYRLSDSLVTRLVSPRVWSGARGVLVQTEAGRRELLRELERHHSRLRAGIESKLEVVANGLDLPPADQIASPGATSMVLSVGRLIPDKGMDTVIEAMAGMPGALTLAGTGPERERLEDLARSRGGEVRFAGFVDRASLSKLYAGARCVVLAARRGEGLPNVLLEAMAWGRPVIATPVAGVRELVRDGDNGLLVAPGDPRALRAALERLAQEPALADRLGAAARRTAESFAWDRVRPRLEEVLERWAA
jgi:glycosyltransferase involved in cell wall biosynthesis